ncbi:uncharacterized protein LOC144744187 [Ciona intestinalis]
MPDSLQEMLQSVPKVTGEERRVIHKLVLEYQDIFATPSGATGRTGRVKHKIDTGTARPIRQPPRRLPWEKRKIAEDAIEDMLRDGIIEPSSSPWASPIVLVEMDSADKEKTAFTVAGKGLFQFKVMPFGLTKLIFLDMWSLGGIHGEERKIEAIRHWCRPTTVTRNFACIAAPLYDLTKKTESFDGRRVPDRISKIERQADDDSSVSAPNPRSKFILDVDASSTGMGAVLSQEYGVKKE